MSDIDRVQVVHRLCEPNIFDQLNLAGQDLGLQLRFLAVDKVRELLVPRIRGRRRFDLEPKRTEFWNADLLILQTEKLHSLECLANVFVDCGANQNSLLGLQHFTEPCSDCRDLV